MLQKLKVTKEEEKKRLDKYLRQHFSEYSRSYLQKLIKKGFVTVNDKKTSVHYFLKKDDQIKADLKAPEKIDLLPDSKEKLDIVFESDDFFVINKRAGLIVHPSKSYKGKTLVNYLLADFPFIKNVGEDRLRPGIVHRLDKDVSGLMVIAKNWLTFEHLKKQFKKHKIKKEYIALVYGRISKAEGYIKFSLFRSKRGKFAAKPQNEKGKKAITYFELIKYLKNYSLLKIKTFTGHTHQIRVHFKALSHPIVGDKLYKNKKVKEKLLFDRIFLHATKLGFFDLKNKWLEFERDLPKNLKEIIKSLES